MAAASNCTAFLHVLWQVWICFPFLPTFYGSNIGWTILTSNIRGLAEELVSQYELLQNANVQVVQSSNNK